MGFHSNNDSNIEMWEWQEDDFSLQRDPPLEVPHCLWDDINQTDNNLSCPLGEQTPIGDCAGFGYSFLDIGSKGWEECRDSSQTKRRRKLQFTDADDTSIGTQQTSSDSLKLKEMEKLLIGDSSLDSFEWNPEWNSSFSGLDQSSEGWLANCFNESKMHRSTAEMSSSKNSSVASDGQLEVSGFSNISDEMENVTVREKPNVPLCRIFKGRKSAMKTPTKLTTSVAYPFTLIKPCGVQGDVTLKDINRRIHAPSSMSKHKKDEDPSPSYPTSTFSGKPVVVKTKIQTEGGKGSIIITRTRG